MLKSLHGRLRTSATWLKEKQFWAGIQQEKLSEHEIV